tara:strand:+ start:989 stop:1459 length:471 start_codon:yes stop_codon:yes gene_type:complete
MANPFDFSSGAILTAAQLNSIGDWTSYTPTWTELTIGNATQDFKYAEVNGIVVVSGRLVWGSTTAITGNIRVTVPVTAANTQKLANGTDFRFIDASGGLYYVGGGRALNTTGVYVYSYNAASTTVKLTSIHDGTAPFANPWTTSDEIIMWSAYEAA